MTDANPWLVVAEVARVFDALGVRYAVGGSLASGVFGEPRSTIDADLVAELKPRHIDPLVAELSPQFYVPLERLRSAVRDRQSVNLIDQDTAVKVDVFVAGRTPLDRDGLDRRRDVVGIVRVQGSRLDRDYLAYGADLLGVTDLLTRVLAQE